MLKMAFKDTSEGVYIRTRKEADLFNVAQLKAKSKTSTKVQVGALCNAFQKEQRQTNLSSDQSLQQILESVCLDQSLPLKHLHLPIMCC